MDMKKILILAALAALVSCQKESPAAEAEKKDAAPVTFELSANYSGDAPATKAIKTGWEAGDVIFVILSGVPAPKHLEMHYDGSSWTVKEMRDYSQMLEPGSLGLSEGDSGMMRAIYYPFNDNAFLYRTSNVDFHIRNDDNGAQLGGSYYLTATLRYEVRDGKVSGAFNMTIPEGFVQFWIEDPSAATSASTRYMHLSMGGVMRSEVQGIMQSTDLKTHNYQFGSELAGYPYNGGWLFSGILDENYESDYGDAFYFMLDEMDGMDHVSSKNLFVPGKTLQSHSAVVLPALTSSRWVEVGQDITVELRHPGPPVGEWSTCGYMSDYPNYLGDTRNFADANSLGLVIPSAEQWNLLFTLPSCIVKAGIWGVGRVFWGEDGGMIFVHEGRYWTSTPGKAVVIEGARVEVYDEPDPSRLLGVRSLKSPTTPTFNGFGSEQTY